VSIVDFWSQNPCDAQADWSSRYAFRYAKEPWLVAELRRIGSQHREILEIGCGQGTDGIEICRAMTVGSYIGVDYSPVSIASAEQAASSASPLPVTPRFEVGDSLQLDFEDGRFDAVYSMGVLHHVADTDRALREIHRVLKPNGVIYIALYNSTSPKVLAARGLRKIQSEIDKISGRSLSLLQISRRFPQQRFGTMLIECFGVPILKSYDHRGMRFLLSNFEIMRLQSIGRYRTFWIAEARKPPLNE
jgi:SAM-dependent methyltransferase